MEILFIYNIALPVFKFCPASVTPVLKVMHCFLCDIMSPSVLQHLHLHCVINNFHQHSTTLSLVPRSLRKILNHITEISGSEKLLRTLSGFHHFQQVSHLQTIPYISNLSLLTVMDESYCVSYFQ